MATIAKQAVSGLNETFQTIRNAQKEHQEQLHFISFVTFNSARIRNVMNRQKVDSDKKLKWTDYRPDDCTPLFDAMGRSLNELKHHVGDEDVVADDMGIRSRMSYDYSPEGAQAMLNLDRSSKRAFYDRLSRKGRRFLMEEEYDYFNPGKDDDDVPEKEPDITWDMEDESLTSTSGTDVQGGNKQDTDEGQQEGTTESSTVEVDEPKEPRNFWSKMKNFIMG